MGNNRKTIKPVLKLLRVKQWVKNTFIFAPLIFANKFTDLELLSQAFIAFIAFCLMASMVYILNDLGDVESDKLHPVKSKERPLASGELSFRSAWLIFALLAVILSCTLYFVPRVVFVLLAYLLINILYSKVLKNKPILDIFTIASGFILRVYAGALAISVTVSNWMFITILCLALFLASMKRRAELRSHGHTSRKVLQDYTPELIDKYAEMASFGTLTFYSLYTVTEQPNLVITIPLVLFGLYRYWFITSKTEDSGESPSDILLRDWPLQVTIGLWGLVVILTFMGVI